MATLPFSSLVNQTTVQRFRIAEDCPGGLFIHVVNTDSSARNYSISLDFDGSSTAILYTPSTPLAAKTTADVDINMEIPAGTLLGLTDETGNVIQFFVGRRSD